MQHIILHILLSTIVTIVVLKKQGALNFLFNDNSDND